MTAEHPMSPEQKTPEQTTIPVNPGGVVFWTGPDHQNKVTEWATLRADEFRRMERESRNWRIEHDPHY